MERSDPLQGVPVHVREFLSQATDTTEYTKALFGKILAVTQAANALPDSDELPHAIVQDSKFADSLKDASAHLLQLADSVMSSHAPDETRQDLSQVVSVKEEFPRSADDVEDAFRPTIDAVDHILEQVDTLLDLAQGLRSETQVHSVIDPHVAASKKEKANAALRRDNNMLRPQLKFHDTVDNSNTPWIPWFLRNNNNINNNNNDSMEVEEEAAHGDDADDDDDDVAMKEGGRTTRSSKKRDRLSSTMESHMKTLGLSSDAAGTGGNFSYGHPFEGDIQTLETPASLLSPCQEQLYQVFSETSCTFVDSVEALKAMVATLERCSEIAIDLEQHAFRSFQGFVCLMQISTRSEDFLVDTLVVRHAMDLLAPVFTNPNIIKVLHGSNSDVLWLQRDFGLYVVNLFDTGQAARVLEFPSYSLAYLLKYYCSVEADKKYQLADWRMRPLPAEMVRYAREDTHYLLYIFDRLRNELLARSNSSHNLTHSVFERSKQLCLLKYEKELINQSSWRKLYNKHNQQFNPSQCRVFAALFAWRDNLARQLDESTGYLVPNWLLFHLAQASPTTSRDVLAAARKKVTPALAQYASEIAGVISNAVSDESMALGSDEALLGASSGSGVGSGSGGGGGGGVMSTPRTPGDSSSRRVIGEHDIATASPVLTTEQLYTEAGWLDLPAETAERNLIRPPRHGASVSQHNHGYNTSQPQSHSLMHDLTNGGVMHDDEDDDGGALPSAAIRHTVAQVHATLAVIGPRGPAALMTDRQRSTSSGHGNGGSGGDKKEAEEEAIPPEEQVPRSFAEIYQLSNLNRARNKKKRTVADDDTDRQPLSADQTQPVQTGSAASTGKKTEGQTGSAHDTVSFLQDVGWVAPDASTQPLVEQLGKTSQRGPSGSATAATGAGPGTVHNVSSTGNITASNGNNNNNNNNASTSGRNRRGRRANSKGTPSYTTDNNTNDTAASTANATNTTTSDKSFTPYDYDANPGFVADRQPRQGAAAQGNRGRGGRRNNNNSNTDGGKNDPNVPNFGRVPRSKVHNTKGQKTMSYHSKRDRSQRTQWPTQ